MVRQVGVERHGVAGAELVALAVDVEHDRAGLDERDLAAAGLVHRRVAGPAGLRRRRPAAWRESSARWPGSGGVRISKLWPLRAEPPWRRSRARDDRHAAALVEAQQLARGADRARTRCGAATASVGLVSPRSTWLSIGALTPERSARSRSERPPASRSALTRGPMLITWSSGSSVDASAMRVRTLSRTSVRRYAPGARQLVGAGTGSGTSGFGFGCSPRATLATASASARR